MSFRHLVIPFGIVAIASAAHATPRPFPYTYQYATTPAGEVEVEQYVDVQPGDVVVDGEEVTRLGFGLQTELEVGLSDHWEAAIYLVSRQPPGGPFEFRGLKERVRGRFAEEGELPIDIGVYLEAIQYADALELEQKLILAKRAGAFQMALNLTIEEEIPWSGGETEIELAPSLGLGWSFSPLFTLGLEYRFEGETEELGEADHWLGPTLHFAHRDDFLTLGVYGHLAGEAEADLAARLLIGIGL